MKNQLLKNKEVAIIGAGPVGLTTARLLQMAGVTVRVYEWDAKAGTRISGGTLDIHRTTGQRALEKAGLLEAFYNMAKPTGERGTDINGRIIMQEFPQEAQFYQRPEIDRNDLRTLLLNSLEPGTVLWNKKFVSLEEDGNQFRIHFEDGCIAVADVVIGANGGRSKVRTYVTADIPQYTGTFIIQGEVLDPAKSCPDYKQLCEEDNLMVLGDAEKMLFSQIKAAGAINYYVALRKNENFLTDKGLDSGNTVGMITFLKDLCNTWDERYKQLFAATDYFSALPMRKMPLQHQWTSSSCLTLIGDAAHVMPPFAGIGVNIGLLDALYLSENLTEGNFSSIREAIDDYENKMFEYARAAQQATDEAETGFFSDEPLEERLKDREEWNKTL